MSDNKEESLAVLFADIVDSTKLYDTIGDELAKKTIFSGIKLMTDIVEQYHGRLVKTIGDEIMTVFPAPDHAVRAAIFMQKMLSETDLTGSGSEGTLAIRVGIHAGPVIHESGDVFGNTVNIAARIIKQCKPRQILASQQVLNGIDPDDPVDSRFIDRMNLKGIHDPFEIHEIIRADERSDGLTAMFDDTEADLEMPAVSSMKFSWGGKEVVLGLDKRSASMGRSPDNDITILQDGVSRLHAKIEFNRNKFTLADLSINGTFVVGKDGAVTKLKRDETVLGDEGMIGLGRAPEAGSPATITFMKI
jgi:class 3 adenylate cyclase